MDGPSRRIPISARSVNSDLPADLTPDAGPSRRSREEAASGLRPGPIRCIVTACSRPITSLSHGELLIPTEITRRNFVGTATAASAVLAGAGMFAPGRQADASSADSNDIWILDSHVHLKHGDLARTEYPTETIIDVMDKVGIAKSVVFAICTTTKRSIEMATAAVEKYPGRLIPYVYALPNYERPAIKEIEEVLDGGQFKGIKIHAGECRLAEYIVDPVFELAAKYDVPCLVDCLGDYPVAERLARKFPRTKFIVAHIGRFLSTDKKLLDRFIGLAKEHPSVFLDTSGVVLLEKIEKAVAEIGSRRMLWGTDGPDKKPDTVTFAQTELDKILGLGISEQDKADILGQTARRLLKL